MVSWIRSLGGPLIAVAEGDLPAWRGGEELGGERNELEEDETDYWRAGEIDEQVGLVRVAGRDALLLNNGPLPTAYLPERALFVQEMAKTSEKHLVDAVTSALPDIAWRDTFDWEAGGSYLLFDAAEAGDQIEFDTIALTLPSGRFKVRVAEISPTAGLNISAFLAQLVPYSA